MRRSPELRRLASGTLMPGFVGSAVPDWLRRAHDDGLAAVALYGSNVTETGGLAPVAAELRGLGPVLVATDEEGGDVTRVHYPHGSPEPGNAVLGRLDDLTRTYDSARRIGTELSALGISLALGPVLDVNSVPDNPVIGVRSFGADPDLVSRHGAAWIRGLQSTGVAACAKHFPGHGATRIDSHVALPVVDVDRQVLDRRELVPFRAAAVSGLRAVMTSHLLVPALDASNVMTFSSRAIDGELRSGLGFAGAVVTDALDMAGASGDIGIPEAAVRALAAGCDLLCLGSRTDEEQYDLILEAILGAVATGRLGTERLERAVDRVERLAEAGSGSDETTGSGEVGDLTAAFEITDTGRRWLQRPGPVAIVQVETETNEAIGHVSWGPAAVDRSVVVHRRDDTTLPGPLLADHRVAVVARAVDAGHPALVVAAGLRDRGRDVVVVDCGWPRGTADITTFGGAPVVAGALLALLRGPVRG